jgi:hypothetical protein
MTQICDMGQTTLLSLRRKAFCGFFRQKNPTASVGFEPAILGSRPLNPLAEDVYSVLYNLSNIKENIYIYIYIYIYTQDIHISRSNTGIS